MVERQNTHTLYWIVGITCMFALRHDNTRACEHTAGLMLLKHSNRNKDTSRHRGKSLQRKLVQAESLYRSMTEAALSYMTVSKVGYCDICYAYILQDYKGGVSCHCAYIYIYKYMLLKCFNFHI